MDVGGARGGFDLGLRGVHFRVRQIRADGIVEEMRLLRHHADRGGQRSERHISQVMPVNADDSAGGIIQSRDEIRQRGFASARWADQCDQLSGTRGKGDSLQSDFACLGCSRSDLPDA